MLNWRVAEFDKKDMVGTRYPYYANRQELHAIPRIKMLSRKANKYLVPHSMVLNMGKTQSTREINQEAKRQAAHPPKKDENTMRSRRRRLWAYFSSSKRDWIIIVHRIHNIALFPTVHTCRWQNYQDQLALNLKSEFHHWNDRRKIFFPYYVSNMYRLRDCLNTGLWKGEDSDTTTSYPPDWECILRRHVIFWFGQPDWRMYSSERQSDMRLSEQDGTLSQTFQRFWQK